MGINNLIARLSPDTIFFWCALYGIAIFATQTGGLLEEVIDWDESTLILMAQSVLDGNLPYTEIFDNKPPLMFIMLAGAMKLAGESLLVVRLFGDMWIFFSSALVMVIARHWNDPISAGLAGLLVVAFHALPIGQYTSYELPAATFLLFALWLLLTRRFDTTYLVLIGFLVSLATLTRSNLAIVAVFLGVYFVVAGFFSHETGTKRWAVLPYVLGGLIPVFIIIAVYAFAGALLTLKVAIVDVPLSYATEQIPITSAMKMHAKYWINYIKFAPAICAPLTLIFFVGVTVAVDQMLSKFRTDKVKRDDILILLLVASAVFLSILVSGAVYQHYWLQVVPLIAIVGSFSLAYMRQRWTPWISCGLVILCLFSAVIRTFQSTVVVLNSPDQITDRHFIQRTANLLETSLLPYDQVWAVKHHLLLWYLDRKPVSWIAAHPSNIERDAIIAPLVSAGYLDSGELQRIYKSYPKFIVTDEEIVPWYIEDKVEFENHLSSHYQEFYREEQMVVFARIDG